MAIASCGQRANTPRTKEVAVDTIMRAHLPFNLHYGMNKDEYEHVKDSLNGLGQLSRWGTEYNFEDVRLGITPYYDAQGRLAQLELSSFGVYDTKQAQSLEKGFIPLVERMLTLQGINLNAYKKTVKDSVFGNKKYHKNISYTKPGYGEIYISNNTILVVQFRNEEATTQIRKQVEESTQQIIKDAIKDVESGRVRQKVENSTLDGSVLQVKNYLKNTLADPKSYDGIEWSPVQKTSDGYKVRHKFRAKNSLGGYVIEEHIFVLNEYGEVIDVI